jgi:hypothetical protein
LVCSDNILGLSNAQGAQGSGAIKAGSKNGSSSDEKNKTGSKASTVIVSNEDNSQHNGVGKGGLLGVGVNALNWCVLSLLPCRNLTVAQ